jgi:hypothetical protein
MKLHFALLILTLCPLSAQNVALPISIGYTEPAPFRAAPGQVVTLFLDDISFGADGRFWSAQAGTGDLPQSLAGISVRITQLDGSETQAPIVAVQQKRLCGLSGLQTGDAGCLLTLVKAQIPFELPGDLVLSDQKIYTLPMPALISIDVDGRRGRGFPLQPVPDNGHVLTTCDASWDTSSSSVCDRQVFHSDGSLATRDAAAHAGETLSVLLYGLGRTDPMVQTGRPSPDGAVITDLIPNSPRVTLGVVTNFVNALSSAPRTAFNSETANATPLPITAASLLLDQIGIYKVSFTLPGLQNPIIPCGGDRRSNSLLFVSTSEGVEAIGLCVQQ